MKVRHVEDTTTHVETKANNAVEADVVSMIENLDYIISNDEGPSLSDDEEESKKYEDRINKTIKASTPFLTGIKTDVELNSTKETHTSKSKNINLPSKTPSGGLWVAQKCGRSLGERSHSKTINSRS